MTQSPQWHCPEHVQPLARSGDALVCPSGETFPVVNEIPRFVPQSNYADAFGAQWNHFRLTQLDSHSGTTITRDRLRRCIGEELWSKLRGLQVLEAGCGAGRFTEILLGEGAIVTSVDLSSAVEANAKNCPVSETHRIAQADIRKMPFAKRQYDVVLCLGVVQHTPSSEETMAALFEHVKPGGWLVIDHYRPSFSWYTKTAPLVRRVLRRLPADKGMRATETLVKVLLPLHKAVRKVRPAQMLLSRVSPVLVYYDAYPQLSDAQHREWSLLDTHDTLTAWYRHLRTTKQIRRYLESIGVTSVWAERGGNGVEARGRRPA